LQAHSARDYQESISRRAEAQRDVQRHAAVDKLHFW